jgi:flagellar biosynthetic protein FliP
MKMTKNPTFKKNILKFIFGIISIIFCIICISAVQSNAAPSVNVSVDSGKADGSSSALDLLFLLAMIALIPSLLLVMTAFTRIIISLSFLRSAIGTQSPPNQVLIGLALFLTIFVMFPTFTQIKDSAYDPYKSGKISQSEAIKEASVPLKKFMLKQVYEDDLDMFTTLAKDKKIYSAEKISASDQLVKLPMTIVIPAFITSEVKRAFMIGFLLYIPFLIIDIIVSSTLMSMGMVMLPPATISLPFKLMLFVLVDGWNLLIQSLIAGFR